MTLSEREREREMGWMRGETGRTGAKTTMRRAGNVKVEVWMQEDTGAISL